MRRSADRARFGERRDSMAKWIRRAIFILLLICTVYAASLIVSTYRLFLIDAGETPPADRQRIVAVIPDAGNVDSDGIRREVERAGERYGVLVEFFETPTKEEQLQVIQIAVDSHADGILLYPMEKGGYGIALAECRQNRIPVVVISQRLENAAFDTFIGSTSTSERMAVLSCIGAAGGTGKVLVVDRLSSGGQLYMEAAALEPAGTEEPRELPELRTKIANLAEMPFEGYQLQSVTVLEDEQASSYSLYTELYRLLDTQRPAAVFSYDEDVTNVIAACLTNTYTLPDIYTVGYGDLEECADQIRNGTLDGLIQQNDAYSASLAVRYLLELRKGGIMPADVDSGFTLVTVNNLERILGGSGT